MGKIFWELLITREPDDVNGFILDTERASTAQIWPKFFTSFFIRFLWVVWSLFAEYILSKEGSSSVLFSTLVLFSRLVLSLSIKTPQKVRLHCQTSWTFYGLSELNGTKAFPPISPFSRAHFHPSARGAQLMSSLWWPHASIHPANLAPFHRHESFTARLGSLWMCASHLFLAWSLSRKCWLLSLGLSCSRVPAELRCHRPRCCCDAFPISKGSVLRNHSGASVPKNPKPHQL